jgi:diguanylate cyclase (GGDEF)-like protein
MIVIAWITIGATALVGRRLDIRRHRAEAELRNMARYDALTGLLNRRSMNISMPQRHAAARSEQQPLTLMMCDLDHFKRLNDEHGHAVGDDVLRRTAQRVHAAVRESDLVFRYGGEEIAVLLECGPADAMRIAEKIREAVKAKGRRAGDEGYPPVTISIGAATSETAKTELKELMAAADECLYAAKHAGRDCVRLVTLP